MEMLSNSARPIDLAAQAQMAADRGAFDILKVLWRWKWLPILGTILGLGIGYLVYTRQTPQYAASALVRVVSDFPASSARSNSSDRDEALRYSQLDESRVIQSEAVLNLAIKEGKLKDKLGMQEMEILSWIRKDKKLRVQPASKDLNTTLIDITFICEDAQKASDVVNAIVTGYGLYLSTEYSNRKSDMMLVIESAQEKFEQHYAAIRKREKELAAENKKAKDAPIFERNDEGRITDPYARSQREIDAEIHAIQVKSKKLLGILSNVAQQKKNKTFNAEAMILTLAAEPWLSLPPELSGINLGSPPTARVKRDSERMREQDLLRLQLEEKGYLDKLGEAHPALKGLRDKIALLNQAIAKIAETESMRDAEDKKLMQEYKDSQPIQAKPLSAAQRLDLQMKAIEQQFLSFGQQEAQLKQLLDINKAKSLEIESYLNELDTLASERRSIENMMEGFQQQLTEIEALPPANQRELKELDLPSMGGFYGPKPLPYLFGGAVLGFIALGGIAVLLDFADKSFRTPDEIAAEMGVPVLGHIPAMEAAGTIKKLKANESIDASICSIHHSKGRVSESFRSIRTGLFFSNRSGDLKVIQVTSPVPGDGKSTLSSNLSVTMAQSGRRVLLVDADFRRPRIAKLFGISGDVGMATVVAGNAEMQDAIHQSAVPNLSIMPGGTRPSNPAELLSSQRFADLMHMLREKFDIIVVDTPPLLAVSDPSAIAAVVDGVVLTMRLRRNVKPLAMRACKILESVDANVLGVVINGVSANAGYGYSYSYSDYRYAYRYRYGSNYYAGGYKGGYDYGTKAYLEESHDVDTGHILAPRETGQES